MANNQIDKPLQVSYPIAGADPIEVSVRPDDEEPNEDGTTVDLGGEGIPDSIKQDAPFDANLAEYLSDHELNVLGSDLCADVAADLESRADWEDTYKKGLHLLGLTIEDRTEPWKGACGIMHPILAEAVVRFQAEVITETFPAAGPVKTKILGAITPEKEQAAERVRDDLNNEITDVMTEYRNEHERLLWNLPIAGTALKKVYYDPTLGRQTSMFVAAEDFIVSYGASDLASCPRYTHRMKKTSNDIRKLMLAGLYRELELSDPVVDTTEIEEEKDKLSGVSPSTETEFHTLYEVNVDLELPGFEDATEIDLPYIVTIDKDTTKILSIYRNWDEDSKTRVKKQHFINYTYIPGFGFYGFGLIHLVGGFAQGATSILRQLVDAGSLSNLPGGLKTTGLRIKGDNTPIGPGEWRDVDIAGGVLRENLMPLPYKEPSAVLAGLLQSIVEEGRKFAAVAEMKVADFDSNSPVGTTMALLERTLKVMSAVQARIYASMKIEFRLIRDLIRDNSDMKYTYDPEGGLPRSIKKQDYQMVDVLPVADPNSATMSQRIVQWQAVMQLAAMAPQIYDLPELHGQMLEILGVKNIDKLIPTRMDNQKPTDPVTENMALMNGKPVKAFLTQDHMSHITVHQSAMQDPKVMQIMGQNPMAQQIQAAAMAHVMEHVAFAYRQQIEKQLGTTLPPPDKPLPPEIEVQISGLEAQAAQKLLGQNQQEAQQQDAQQKAQDPVIQMQQQQLQLDSGELERKKAKDQADNQLKQLQLQQTEADAQRRDATERLRIQSDVKLRSVATGIQAITSDSKIKAQQASQQAQTDASTKSKLADMAMQIVGQQHDKSMQAAEFAARPKTPPKKGK